MLTTIHHLVSLSRIVNYKKLKVAFSTGSPENAHISNYSSLLSELLCHVHDVTLHVDHDTDETYAQMTLQPLKSESQVISTSNVDVKHHKRPNEFFCKTLTASDISTHGGFSVPRRAAEKLFPLLDYSAQPPKQELVFHDLHHRSCTFRHIYRGQPRRHLLTTGWSVFVGAKRLRAGDSVLFIRGKKSQLLLGVRRANHRPVTQPSSVLSIDSMHVGVLAAAAHAASNRSPFTVFYNPRACPSAFVIPLEKYNKSVLGIQLSAGLRFGMMFETEESVIHRYMGTVTGISDVDPIRWPTSKWRNLQVGWDDPGFVEGRDRVSLWEIEIPERHFYPAPCFNVNHYFFRNFFGAECEQNNMLKRPLSAMLEGRGDNLQYEISPTHGSEVIRMMVDRSPISQVVNHSFLQNQSNELSPTFSSTMWPFVSEASVLQKEMALQEKCPFVHYQEELPSAHNPLPTINSCSQSVVSAQALDLDKLSSTVIRTLVTEELPSEKANKNDKHNKESDGHLLNASRNLEGVQKNMSLLFHAGSMCHCSTSEESVADKLIDWELDLEDSSNQPYHSKDSSLLLTSQMQTTDARSLLSYENHPSPPWYNRILHPSDYISPANTVSYARIPGTFAELDNATLSLLNDTDPVSNASSVDIGMCNVLEKRIFRCICSSCPPCPHPSEGLSATEEIGFPNPLECLADSSILSQDVQSHITSGSFGDSHVLSRQEFADYSGCTSSNLEIVDSRLQQLGRHQQLPFVRTYTKVQKLGSVGRSIDVTRYQNYDDLKSAIESMFGLEGLLHDHQSSGWELVYVDYENDILLVGDDPWEDFVRCVKSIKILSPSEVQQIRQEGMEVNNSRIN